MTATAWAELPEVTAPRRTRFVVLSNPKVAIGLGILAFFALLTLSEPIFEATVWAGKGRIYDPVIGFDTRIAHPSAPSPEHWLGTNSLGHDVFAMLIEATRPTLLVAVSAGAVIAAISLTFGAVAAVREGWVDGVISHVSDAMVVLPPLLAVYVLGIWRPNDEFGALHAGVAFGVLYGIGPATATVRAAAMSVTIKPFMDAARVAGGGDTWLVTRHVLPHCFAYAAVQAMIGATGAVIAEAFLSFRSAVGEDIGFGAMVYDGIVWADLMAGIADTPWWIMLAGAGGITLLAAAFYLIGVGLREALDPRARSILR
jgi:peptide/nickel transport system permease protein